MSNTKHIYSWIKQKPDSRDLHFSQIGEVKKVKVAALPPVVNLRRWQSSVFDQGELGSCTANAWAGLMQFHEIWEGRGGKQYQDLSRLFIYYNERVLDGTVNEDAGSELRSGASVLNKYGVCTEKEWPYIISKFTQKPTPQCYTDATPHIINSYYAITNFNSLKVSLANALPFVFGFSVYDSFESDAVAASGVVPMPDTKNETLLGGHAVLCVGYNDFEKRFLVKNSWGTKWGLKGNNAGYFTLPYDFVSNSNLASDFWTVVKVAEDK